MTVHTLQVNMTKGELTPYLHARADTEFYQGGLQRLRNACVLRYGGVTRVPGTLHQGFAKDNARTARFIRFEFNREQVYAIEAGHLYFRFWTRDGRIESPPGTPVEVVTPYAEADLKYLQVRQSGDVIYIWCRKDAGGAYQPRTLTRNSETSWTLAVYDPKAGPFLTEDTKGTYMTPASYAAVTVTKTSNAAPTDTVSNNEGDGDAYQAFDRDAASRVNWGGGAGTITYLFSGASRVADGYWIQASTHETVDTPQNWTFEGFDGVAWVVLDTRDGESNWGASERRRYSFPNETAYAGYRLVFGGGGGSDGLGAQFAEIGIHERAENQTPFNLTASSVTGINDGQGFLATDVGRVIRLLGEDAVWRNFTIVSRTSSTVVTGRLDGHALPSLKPMSRWQLGAFSEETGWPTAGAIFEDRLFHASTANDPLGVWGSVSADYDSFRVSQPVVDDDGLSLRLTGGKLNEIGWLNENRDLVAGTAGSLRAIGRNDGGKALSPSNVRQRTETIAPSSRAEPIAIENVILFMDFFEQRLYEAAFTYEVEGYLAREVSTLNEHLFAAGVVSIVYLQHPHKIVVGRRADGKLVFFTYDREQKVTGGSLIDFGGEVEAILDLPGDVGTDLWMVVKRTINGTTRRHIELLAEFWREDYTVQDAPVYAANALIYEGAATGTLTGLTHLVGETVGIWANGRDVGDAVVDGAGQVTLPDGLTTTQAVVGLRMDWEVKTLRLAQIGNQDGSGLGRPVNIGGALVDFYEAAGVSVGSTTLSGPFQFDDESEENPDDPVPLRTGMFNMPVDDSWRNTGVLYLGGSRMYPATVRGVSLQIEGAP